ncbi:PsiF family protein [soil metagenome]
MMKKVFPRTTATAVAFSLMLAGSAFAQGTATPAPAAKTAPDKMAPAKPKAERTAASLECSKQADAKGLHGKERKKFRSECKASATKAN